MSMRVNLKVWAALIVAGVGAAMVLAMIVVVLDAGKAQAATASNATIQATPFTALTNQTVEASAVCPGTKRALGGGVLQSGTPYGLYMNASGPLDGTGVTANTNDGDIARYWDASLYNWSLDMREFKVLAICE